MGKGLSARPGDEALAYQYFESFSPLPGERCRAAWDALPEREKVGWFRRAQRADGAARYAVGSQGEEQSRQQPPGRGEGGVG